MRGLFAASTPPFEPLLSPPSVPAWGSGSAGSATKSATGSLQAVVRRTLRSSAVVVFPFAITIGMAAASLRAPRARTIRR